MARTQSTSKQKELDLGKYYLIVSAESLGDGEQAFYRTYGKSKANQICRALNTDPAVGDQVPSLKFKARPATNLRREVCVICDRFIDSLNANSLAEDFDPASVEANNDPFELLQLFNYLALFWDMRIRADALQQPSYQAVANALVVFQKLDWLIGTYRDYPNGIASEEALQLFNGLTKIMETSLNDPLLRNCKHLYRQPRFGDSNLPFDGAVFGSQLLMLHPRLNRDRIEEPESTKHMDQLVRDCEAAADDNLKRIAKRIEQIMVVDCRMPHSELRPDFNDKRRHVQMLNVYWSLCYHIMVTATNLADKLGSFPLNDALEYLRSRIEVLFKNLSGVATAQKSSRECLGLLKSIVDVSPGDLKGMLARVHRVNAHMNSFIVRTQQALGSAIFELTDAEEFFIENCNERLARFRQAARRAAIGDLSEEPVPLADALVANQHDLHSGATSVQASVQFGDPGKPCQVLGKQKKPLSDCQRAILQQLREAGDKGLTKDDIEKIRPGARQILRCLKKDEDWNEVLLMAGSPGGRYRLLG